MSKIKFVLPIATTLGVAFILSCSSSMEEVAKTQCTVTQGEWNEVTKQCESCPQGTNKFGDGRCVAPPIQLADGTFICPARTTKSADGLCVADIIAVDPNAATGKYYCDYGKLDPLAVDTHDNCIEIEYQSQCDTWGKLVPSCQAKDRRIDIKYCDYGPKDEWSEGGCYWILNAKDCDTEYGIVDTKCGNHGKYPNGTVCPVGKTKIKVGNINECRTGDAGITDGTATHCDWGVPSTDEKGESTGGCWPMNTQDDRNNCLRWGKGVKTCPNYNNNSKYCFYGTASQCYQINNSTEEAACDGLVVTDCNNVSVSYCDYGQPTITADGSLIGNCWAITTKTKDECSGTINNSCPNYTCPAGTTKFKDDVWGSSACELTATPSTKYCYYGKATECWEISDYGDIKTESDCEENYGQVVQDCNNVLLKYCDWGQPIIKSDGTVDKGCFSIRSAKDLQGCQYGTILDSCPNYTCPDGTKKMNDYGWGISACELE